MPEAFSNVITIILIFMAIWVVKFKNRGIQKLDFSGYKRQTFTLF